MEEIKITLVELVEKLLTRDKEVFKNTTETKTPSYFLACLVEELGEAAKHNKRVERGLDFYPDILKTVQEFYPGLGPDEVKNMAEAQIKVKVSKEYADIIFYALLGIKNQGLDPVRVLLSKYNEVCARYDYQDIILLPEQTDKKQS